MNNRLLATDATMAVPSPSTAGKKPTMSPAARDILSGTVAGIASIIVCHPLDTLRVRMQTTNAARFTGLADVLSKTVSHEGVLALWKGLSVPLFAQGIQKATMFYGSGVARRTLVHYYSPSSPNTLPPLTLTAICGAVGGVSNAIVATPIELVRTRLQVQYHSLKAGAINTEIPRYTGPIDCARQVLASSGIRGLWTGFVPMVLRDGPGVAMWFTGFEATRRALTKDDDPKHVPKWKLMVSGACGGLCFWVFGFPQDTIKSIIQTESAAAALGAAQHTTSFLGTTRQLIAKDGIGRLWRGFPIAALRAIPGASIVFTVQTLVSERLQHV